MIAKNLELEEISIIWRVANVESPGLGKSRGTRQTMQIAQREALFSNTLMCGSGLERAVPPPPKNFTALIL